MSEEIRTTEMLSDHLRLNASDIIEELRKNNIDVVTTVPDLVQMSVHMELEKPGCEIQYIPCCAENQALTCATGLYIGGKRPLVMMQNQGLYNCLNTLRTIALDAGLPLLMMVGQFSREFENVGKDPKGSVSVMVNRMEPLLEALGIPVWRLDKTEDVVKITEAADTAFEESRPAVLLIGTYTNWS